MNNISHFGSVPSIFYSSPFPRFMKLKELFYLGLLIGERSPMSGPQQVCQPIEINRTSLGFRLACSTSVNYFNYIVILII